MKITITRKTDHNADTLKCLCHVRYWEDATVDGIVDKDGSLIPCRVGDCWAPEIDLATGKIKQWKAGVAADIHYKIADGGTYTLLDGPIELVTRSGYVPKMMCPGGDGYGDYVIMNVNSDGVIENFRADASYFEEEK